MTTESTSPAQAAPRRVFLSHSTKDKTDIGKLRDALISHGVNAWEDVLELRLGDSLAELQRAIEAADAFVLLLTPASIGSEWVQREVGWAHGAKATRPGYVLLPLLRGLDRPALNLFGAPCALAVKAPRAAMRAPRACRETGRPRRSARTD